MQLSVIQRACLALGSVEICCTALHNSTWPWYQADSVCVSAAVYSARNEGKAHCFDLIRERFGDDCNYVAIGNF